MNCCSNLFHLGTFVEFTGLMRTQERGFGNLTGYLMINYHYPGMKFHHEIINQSDVDID